VQCLNCLDSDGIINITKENEMYGRTIFHYPKMARRFFPHLYDDNEHNDVSAYAEV
jgi:hypothetical protein